MAKIQDRQGLYTRNFKWKHYTISTLITTPCKVAWIFACILYSKFGIAQGTSNEPVLNKIAQQSVRYNGTDYQYYNKHSIASYYRSVAGVQPFCPDCATCAAAVWTWHLEAGIRPKLKGVAMARNWANCKYKLIVNSRPSEAVLGKIRAGMTVVYRFPESWHVGVLVDKYGYYATVSESNTSKSQGSKIRGQYLKIRPYSMMVCLCDWSKDAEVITDSTKLKILQSKYKIRP